MDREDVIGKLRLINKMDNRYLRFNELLGIEGTVCLACQMIGKSYFVIPMETRWKCKWPECCCCHDTPAMTLPPGMKRKHDGYCIEYDDKKGCTAYNEGRPVHVTCQAFPFGWLSARVLGDDKLLLIDRRCPGLGEGPIITWEDYDNIIQCLILKKRVRTAKGE